MKVAIVVARSRNNVIGNGSEIPWLVKGEQKLFKEITLGGTLIMGRKTYESIGRPLPGRETIIVTRNPGYAVAGCHTASSLEDALKLAESLSRPVYVVGGGQIYREALPLVDAVHISTIDTDVEGDITFPDFPTDDFRLVSEKGYESNINYTYRYYERVVR